jgi:hypothetical protein
MPTLEVRVSVMVTLRSEFCGSTDDSTEVLDILGFRIISLFCFPDDGSRGLRLEVRLTVVLNSSNILFSIAPLSTQSGFGPYPWQGMERDWQVVQWGRLSSHFFLRTRHVQQPFLERRKPSIDCVSMN